MTHISPWSAREALFEGAVGTLSAGAPLYLYGPYRRGGAQSFEPRRIRCEPSRSQRRVRRPRSGGCRGPRARERFGEPQIVDMPASNLSVIFHHT
ncbi:class I SAM-dependent methyltransferase [Methylocystis sp. NLS-7]|nr:class I SAM-dependent methyltransferase [Methylocystis suflitae]